MDKRLFLAFGILVLFLTLPGSLFSYSFYSRIDPYPVFTASNPYGSFTAFQDCEQAYRVRFSGSVFRQNAFWAGVYNDQQFYTTTQSSSSMIGPSDIPIGDMYGRWNILGLFYPESGGATTTDPVSSASTNVSVQDSLVYATGTLLTQDKFNPALYGGTIPLGTMSVPIEYRKYGGRFEFDFCSCFDVGLSLALSIAQAQQCPGTFSLGYGTDEEVAALMTPDSLRKIGDALDLSFNHFCKSEIEAAVLSLYWRHSFQPCAPSDCEGCSEEPYVPTFTFTPFIKAEIAPFSGIKKPASMLFGIPFGNGGHMGYGLLCGFTVNFFETILIGFDAGATAFSKEFYPNWPVPTHLYQAGIFPRRADLEIAPGNNWCFGAGFWAPCFVDNFSASVEFRYVHHCTDSIDVLRTLSLSVPRPGIVAGAATPPPNRANVSITKDDFPISNVALSKMIQESCWSTCMVNAGLTYDISKNLELGVFWQAPVRQRFTYRPTTVMGSVVLSF